RGSPHHPPPPAGRDLCPLPLRRPRHPPSPHPPLLASPLAPLSAIHPALGLLVVGLDQGRTPHHLARALRRHPALRPDPLEAPRLVALRLARRHSALSVPGLHRSLVHRPALQEISSAPANACPPRRIDRRAFPPRWH